MADQGNAVTARWVGPSGQQLWDGSRLEPGVIVEGLGYDEAEGNPYWEIVKPSKGDVISADVSGVRDDWSFELEEGGEGTGRPGDVNASPDPAPTTEPDPVQVPPGASLDIVEPGS